MNRPVLIVLSMLGLLALLAATVGLVAAWNAFQAISSLQVKLLIVVAILVALPLIGFCLKRAYLAWLDIQHAKEELAAKQDARRRMNEKHEVELHLAKTRLPADEQGNRAFIYHERTGQVIEVASGNFIPNVPTHYAPHSTYTYRDTSTHATQEEYKQGLLPSGPREHPSMDYVIALLQENARRSAWA